MLKGFNICWHFYEKFSQEVNFKIKENKQKSNNKNKEFGTGTNR